MIFIKWELTYIQESKWNWNTVCVWYILASWSLVSATLELFIWDGFQYALVEEKYIWKETDHKNQNCNLIQVIISFIIFIDLFPVYQHIHSVYASYFMPWWVLIMKFSFNDGDAKLWENQFRCKEEKVVLIAYQAFSWTPTPSQNS